MIKRVLLLLFVIGFLVVLAYGQTLQVPYSGNAPYSGAVPYSGNTPVTVVCPSGTATISGNTITCPSGSTRIKVTPSGGDDRAAIYAAAAKGPMELSCAGTNCTFKLAPDAANHTLPNNTDIFFDDGVLVDDPSAYTGFEHMFALYGVSNIKFSGTGSASKAVLKMPITYARNFGAACCPVNMIIWMESATNVSITGLGFDHAGGDSVYMGKSSSGVTVDGIVSTYPIRNSVSATAPVTNITIKNSDLGFAVNRAALIGDGIDMEPNGSADAIKNVVITNVFLHDNWKSGVCLCLFATNSSTPMNYTVTNSRADRNGYKAFEKSVWPSPMNGTVTQSGLTANGSPTTFQ